MMQFYIEIDKPDSGSLSISKNDPVYSQIEIGKLIKVVYRGQPRGSGGFFVENIQRDDVKSGDLGEEWVKITGRGALSILEDAIVGYDESGEAQRSFASQTMAGMLITLLTEAQARGCFPKLRWNFSAVMDSAGDAWEDLQPLSFSVESSLLDVLASMTDLGIDFKMSYDWVLGDYVLYGYALGIGDLQSGVVFRKGLNAAEVTDTQESGELKNAYLVQFSGGSTWVNDAASASAYRRREAAFSAGSADNASDASMLANVQLGDTKDPKRQISIKVSDAAGPRVFVDYGIGDWVYYDRGDGQTPSLYRIRAMTLDWGDIQYPSITLDLNSILLEREIKNEIALRKIGGGNIGSTLSSPTDAGAELTLHKTDATAHSSRPLGGDLAGTLGVPGVAKLRGVALDNPLTISNHQVLKFDSALSKLVGADVDWTEIASKPGTFPPAAHTHVEADITDLDAVPEAPVDDSEYVRKNAGWVANSGGSGADVNAVHVNEAAEINGITEKTSIATDDLFLIEDSANSYNKKRVRASNLPAGGGGYVGSFVVLPLAYYTSSVGTWIQEIQSNMYTYFRVVNSSGAQNDYLEWHEILLRAGTYKVKLLTHADNNRGIVTITVDSTDIGTIDLYAGSTTLNTYRTATGLVVSTTGLHAIRLTGKTKNASSSGYSLPLGDAIFIRTGD
jgi:hypothetical protein